MAIDYGRFSRLVSRCQEIVAAPRAPRVLDLVYRRTAEAPLERYMDATAVVDAAMDRWRKALADRTRALRAMDGPFRTGRAAVKAIVPETELPGTLKVQPTDTDKRQAIERVLQIIAAYRGQAWADAILQGDIGQQAASTVAAIHAANEAASALQQAQHERARVFKDARIAFYAFKKLVRRELGAASNEYRRLQVRSIARREDGELVVVEEDVEQGESVTEQASPQTIPPPPPPPLPSRATTAPSPRHGASRAPPQPPPGTAEGPRRKSLQRLGDGRVKRCKRSEWRGGRGVRRLHKVQRRGGREVRPSKDLQRRGGRAVRRWKESVRRGRRGVERCNTSEEVRGGVCARCTGVEGGR